MRQHVKTSDAGVVLTTWKAEKPMSTLIAIVYPSEQKAKEVRSLLFDLSTRYLIKPGDAALLALVQEMTADKVLAEIQPHGGTGFHTTLDESREKMLRDALASAAAAAPEA